MRFVTDQQAQALPSLRDADAGARDQILSDAAALYEHVQDNAWIDEATLRTWAEARDVGPDRATAALAFLSESGQLLPVSETPVTPEPPPDSPAAALSMTVEELQERARELDVPGRSKMSKAELAQAVAERS